MSERATEARTIIAHSTRSTAQRPPREVHTPEWPHPGARSWTGRVHRERDARAGRAARGRNSSRSAAGGVRLSSRESERVIVVVAWHDVAAVERHGSIAGREDECSW